MRQSGQQHAGKLVPCIRTDDLWTHMQAFQAIADANPGADGHPSRNSGEPGYKASVDYVAEAMRKAGYDVTIQPYTFTYSSYVGTPTLERGLAHRAQLHAGQRVEPGQQPGRRDRRAGQAGRAAPCMPPTPTPSSASGCTPSRLRPASCRGKIALIQRGSCNFGVKVLNAEAAGAVGVVIFNEGNPGRTGVFSGSMVDATATRSWRASRWRSRRSPPARASTTSTRPAQPPVMNLEHPADRRPEPHDYNVIAESKGGDPNHVVVVDAHLDAIYGAGMLDNASGSATILDIAQRCGRSIRCNKLRFIWFGGEELGAAGLEVLRQQPQPERARQDRLRPRRRRHGDAELLHRRPRPGGRRPVRAHRQRDVPAAGVRAVEVRPRPRRSTTSTRSGRTTSCSPRWEPTRSNSTLAGVPASGLLTGQDCCKTQEEVDLFGGYLGNYEGNVPSFDGGCVDNPFRWCDNLSNNDPTVFTFMSKAFADMTVRMAYNTTVLGSGGKKGAAAKAVKAGQQGATR